MAPRFGDPRRTQPTADAQTRIGLEAHCLRTPHETLAQRGPRTLYTEIGGQTVKASKSSKVRYGDLLPHELEARLRERPVGYLPVGTLEWHGPHNPLGADYIQAAAILERAADRFGGVVLPPLWLGPDEISMDNEGSPLLGMDNYVRPPRQLPGSLYWVPQALFVLWMEAILSQARRVGFRCLVVEGHGPSRDTCGRAAKRWRKQYGIHVLSALSFPGAWATQTDHAGRNETSILMAVRPDLVDLARLSARREEEPLGVIGEDPRDSTATQGEELIERTLELIGAKLDELGV